MPVSKLISLMMRYFNDVSYSEHAMKVYAYSQSIGMGESLPDSDMHVLCAAAILHDIGIPQAIKIHGSAKGEYQEKEGALLVPGMLSEAGIHGITERVSWLVGNHHTHALAEGDLLLQILMEADYLVNLAEGNSTKEKIRDVGESFFKTCTGKEYIEALFGV